MDNYLLFIFKLVMSDPDRKVYFQRGNNLETFIIPLPFTAPDHSYPGENLSLN